MGSGVWREVSKQPTVRGHPRPIRYLGEIGNAFDGCERVVVELERSEGWHVRHLLANISGERPADGEEDKCDVAIHMPNVL